MLRKLRTDLRLKLKNITLILLDAGIIENSSPDVYSVNGDNEYVRNNLSRLKGVGVEVYAFSNNASSVLADLYNINILRKEDLGNRNYLEKIGINIHFNDTSFMISSEDDIHLIDTAVFSYTPAGASLDVKMRSSYCSHLNGIDAFLELSELIIYAKSPALR